MKAPAVLLAAIATLSPLYLSAAFGKKAALEVTYMPTADFPQNLIQRGIKNGEVDVVVSIDPQGRAADWLVTATTDPAFEKMTSTLLPEVEFKLPASETPAGPVRVRLRLFFEARGIVVSHTVNDTMDNLVNRLATQRRIEKLGTPRQLDRALATVHTVAPHYPQIPQDAAGARVTLEFLVDESGRVRMPVLHAGENRLLADAAANALLDWRFSPPTRDGRPVIVVARQEFILPPR